MAGWIRSGVRWVALGVLSVLLSLGLHWASIPAALLLGPMLAGVGFALREVPLRLSGWSFSLAQAVIGCMVARALSPSVFETLARHWPAILAAIAVIIASGGIVGLLLMRLRVLPGSTAAWGSTPGGAAAMTALAHAYGADVRMVAFMQYLRLFVVVLSASLISRFLLGHAAELPGRATWTLGLEAPLIPLSQTLLLILGGMLLARRLPLPAGAMLLPMVVGAVLNSTGIIQITLPFWLVGIAYAALGWYVGLRFTAGLVRYALGAVPQMLLATVLLIVLCCGAAWILVVWLDVDVLSAFLATSPGGLDTVAAIALGSGCDVSFVLTVQTLRLFAVILFGPLVARWICRLSRDDR